MNIEIPQSMKKPPTSPNPGIPTHPPAVTILDLRDPTAAGEKLPNIKLDAVQLVSKPLRARRILLRLNNFLVANFSTNVRVRTHTTLENGLIGYATFGPKVSGTANGLPIGPGQILTSPSGIELEFIVNAGYESIVLLVSPDDVRSHLRARHRDDRFSIPSHPQLLNTSSAASTKLFNWSRTLIDTAVRQPRLFDLPQTQAAASIELIEMLLEALSSVSDSQPEPHHLTRQAHGRIVRIAENYALSHLAERPSVTNLCEAAQVSERTLQNAFKKVMGMTPVAYLTRVRLHRVRQALRAASPRKTTVTAEALKYGFWHFGDFARAYKACFGDLPSNTLRASTKRKKQVRPRKVPTKHP